jgi:Ca2+-binding RTX toxin-like protein
MAITGTSGDDLLVGTSGNDILDGLEGNDRLEGGSGNDTLIGGAGDDLLEGGAGADQLMGGDGNDELIVDTDDTVIDGGAGRDALRVAPYVTTGVTIDVGAHNIEIAIGGVGNDVFTNSGSAAVLLQGWGGDDWLSGGSGDDRLEGGSGNDTYVYSLDGGWDVIEDASGDDTLFIADSSVGGAVIRNSNDLNAPTTNVTFRDTAGNEIEDQEVLIYASSISTSLVEHIRLWNGQTVDSADVVAQTLTTWGDQHHNRITTGSADDTIYAMSGNDVVYAGAGYDTVYTGEGNDQVYGEGGRDVLYGEQGRDLLDGGAGKDQLFGGESDDQLYGGAGNDTLDGGEGKDLLVGGTGDDVLDSGNGDDTIRFGRGDGHDTLIGLENNQGDIVSFGAGINVKELWFTRENNDLTVTVLNQSVSGDKLTITDWYSSRFNQVDEFRTAGGASLDAKNVDQLVQAMSSFAPPLLGADMSLPTTIDTQLSPIIAAAWDDK